MSSSGAGTPHALDAGGSQPDCAIVVDDVSKVYQIYAKPQHRLWQGLFRGRRTFYREFWALRNISFRVEKGETYGIIGRNGAGKSTLLQIICGTLTPTSGSVRVNGRVAALLELGAGFDPGFTGHENIYMNAAILGLSREQVDDKYDSIVAFADIGEFIHQPVKTYSSGMYVRLAFAIIAHVDADILVIDEALAVGDAFFRQKCMRFLRSFREHGTILFVSHDTAAVVNFCHGAVWLENGAKKMEGGAKEVTERYLEEVHESRHADRKRISASSSPAVMTQKVQRRDLRARFINCSNLRNDLEVFEFREDAPSFGKGGLKIVNVELCDGEGAPLSWVVGGEDVAVVVTAVCNVEVERPIIGFSVKDRLGQVLFSDNTHLIYRDRPLSLRKGEILKARFEFSMPLLPKGEFSISAAAAEGTQSDHMHHHWIHDALIFRSHRSSVVNGLVGVPMHNIELHTDSAVERT